MYTCNFILVGEFGLYWVYGTLLKVQNHGKLRFLCKPTSYLVGLKSLTAKINQSDHLWRYNTKTAYVGL